MAAIDVPRGEWPEFLDRFAHAHRDALVNVLLEERPDGDSAGVRAMALAAILVDEDAAGHASVTIETRQDMGPSATHTVTGVTRVHVLHGEDGAESALALEGDGGKQLLMNLVVRRSAGARHGVPSSQVGIGPGSDPYSAPEEDDDDELVQERQHRVVTIEPGR